MHVVKLAVVCIFVHDIVGYVIIIMQVTVLMLTTFTTFHLVCIYMYTHCSCIPTYPLPLLA